MRIEPFALERYFARYEFAPDMKLLCSSDCDGLKQAEVVSWADEEMKRNWDEMSLGYTEVLGNPVLRNEIAKLYQGVSFDEVLILAPEEGIFIAMNCLLQAGDHVIYTAPAYESLFKVANGLGCEVDPWHADEANGWRFDPDFLQRSIKPNTRALIVNFPHNPTGYLPSQEEFVQILKIAEKHDLYVFSDEMYRFLEHDSKDRLPSAAEMYGKAVSLLGMSKTFGMAGVRIGWLVTKDKSLYDKMVDFKLYTTICPPAPSETLSIIALRSKDKILDRHLARINRNLGVLDNFFQEYHRLFHWVRPRAGTIGFPMLLTGESSYDFAERSAQEAKVMLVPSKVIGYGDQHFRIGFGRENMPEVLEQFKGFLKGRYTN